MQTLNEKLLLDRYATEIVRAHRDIDRLCNALSVCMPARYYLTSKNRLKWTAGLIRKFRKKLKQMVSRQVESGRKERVRVVRRDAKRDRRRK